MSEVFINLIFGASGFVALVSSIAMGAGMVFLAIWAFKFMSKEDLWKWGWMLLIGGMVLTFVVAAVVHMAVNTTSLGDIPVPGDSVWDN